MMVTRISNWVAALYGLVFLSSGVSFIFTFFHLVPMSRWSYLQNTALLCLLTGSVFILQVRIRIWQRRWDKANKKRIQQAKSRSQSDNN